MAVLNKEAEISPQCRCMSDPWCSLTEIFSHPFAVWESCSVSVFGRLMTETLYTSCYCNCEETKG